MRTLQTNPIVGAPEALGVFFGVFTNDQALGNDDAAI